MQRIRVGVRTLRVIEKDLVEGVARRRGSRYGDRAGEDDRRAIGANGQ